MDKLKSSREKHISQDTEIEWVEVPKSVFMDITFIVVSIALILAYKTNQSFKSFIDLNYEYLQSSLDLLLIFILFILIPYIFHWLVILTRILRKLFISFRTITIRMGLRIFRSNLAVIGFTAIILSLAINKPFLSREILIPTIAIWLLMNWLFLDYDALREQEVRLSEIYETKGKLLPELTTFQAISFIIFVINLSLLELKIGDHTLKELELSIYYQIALDLPLLVIFWLTFVFVFLWFIISFIASLLIEVIINHKVGIIARLKWLFLIAILYFFGKMLVFNISIDQPSYLQSFYSIFASGLIGTILKKSKSIINFFSREDIESSQPKETNK